MVGRKLKEKVMNDHDEDFDQWLGSILGLVLIILSGLLTASIIVAFFRMLQP